jgi:transposase
MKFIGLDVHKAITQVSVSEEGKEILNCAVPTDREKLRRVIETIHGPRQIVVEEGQLADWCKRNLQDLAQRFVVSDPRWNRLVSEAEDKNDRVDAYRLGLLLWLGQIREVYHADVAMQKLKEAVTIYWQTSGDLTRAKNRLSSQLARRGISAGAEMYRMSGYELWREQYRQVWGETEFVDRLFRQVEFFRQQKAESLKQLRRLQTGYRSLLRLLKTLPGYGRLVAVSFLAYIGDPWRFPNKRKLWKYCGLAIRKRESGGKSRGRPKRSRAYNRHLRNILGIAAQAVMNRKDDNSLTNYGLRRRQQGAPESHVRRDVARKLAVTAWVVLKTRQKYCEQKVRY